MFLILSGCSDVVKKPKLDTHRLSCNASFTCIDCSTTFSGPAQYKGHTSCVSEAEKYQKGLYKGPKGVRPSSPRSFSPYFLTIASQQQNIQQNQNGQNLGRQNNFSNSYATGTYQSISWGGGGGRGTVYARYEATGANDTPLGTPARMSPVTAVPEESPATNAINVSVKADVKSVQKAQETNGSAKKSKKRKSVDGDAETTAAKKVCLLLRVRIGSCCC